MLLFGKAIKITLVKLVLNYVCIVFIYVRVYIYVFLYIYMGGEGILVEKRLFMLLKGSMTIVTGLVLLFVSPAMRKSKF